MTTCSGKGPAIVEYFEKTQKFKKGDSKKATRRLIGFYITQYIITKKQKFSCYDKKHLSDKIAKLFPCEDSNFWYTLDEEGNGPGGYFQNSIKNQRHRIKQERAVTPPLKDEIQPVDENVTKSVDYLSSHPDCLPWNKVEKAWNVSRIMRRKDLDAYRIETKKLKKNIKKTSTNVPLYSIEGYIDKWSNLKSNQGQELVNLDFNIWYPAAVEFNEHNFDNLLKILKMICAKRKIKKWNEEINNAEILIESSDNIDVVLAAKLRLLPMLVSPRGRTSSTSKTSVEKCETSIILLVKDFAEIDDAYKERAAELKKLNKPLSAMLIIVGENWKNINGVHICINHVRWQIKNLIAAFDTLFKTFYVLETLFPKESSVL
ncbi:uncharacterized protein LOC122855032 [Aphidius gifuensis]|nr:uncharacterized protein LOC122855032 [Aphidius gifuensis]